METFTFTVIIQTDTGLTEAQIHSALSNLLDRGMTACEYDSNDKSLPYQSRVEANEVLSLNITFEPT